MEVPYLVEVESTLNVSAIWSKVSGATLGFHANVMMDTGKGPPILRVDGCVLRSDDWSSSDLDSHKAHAAKKR